MVRLSVVRAIGHNIADSFSSGASMLFGFYDFDPYREAADQGGTLVIDFISGEVLGGVLPRRLVREISSGAAVKQLLLRSGIPSEEIVSIRAEFTHSGLEPMARVTVQTRSGRLASDTYVGRPLRRRRVLDRLGRVRTLRRPSRGPDRPVPTA